MVVVLQFHDFGIGEYFSGFTYSSAYFVIKTRQPNKIESENVVMKTD